MKAMDAVLVIINRSPWPKDGERAELHVEPSVYSALMAELNNSSSNDPVRPTAPRFHMVPGAPPKTYYLGMELVKDPTACFAEVVIRKDKPKRHLVWDLLSWRKPK